jgi:hypothetical protein
MAQNRDILLNFILSQRQRIEPDPARQMFQVAGTSVRPTTANNMMQSAVANVAKQKQAQAQAQAQAAAAQAAHEAELERLRTQYGQQAASRMTSAQVAQANRMSQQAAAAPQATVAQTQTPTTVQQIQNFATHPLQSMTGRENNFDMLAGIPGYIATVAAPNTAYNLTVGLPDTAADIANATIGASGELLTGQPISPETKLAAYNTANRLLDASAVLPVGKAIQPVMKVFGPTMEEVAMAGKHILHSGVGQVAEQAAHKAAHKAVHHQVEHLADHGADQNANQTHQYTQNMNNSYENPSHAYGGLMKFLVGGSKIHIDPSKKGTFTAQATRMNMGIQEAARHIMANKEDYSPEMVKKAVFAHNFAKQMGGSLEQYGYAGEVSPNAPIDFSNYVPAANNTYIDRSGAGQPMQIVNGALQYVPQPQIKPAATPTVNGRQITGYTYDGTPLYKHDMGGLAKFIAMYPLQKFDIGGYTPDEPGFAPNMFPARTTRSVHTDPEVAAQAARQRVQQTTVHEPANVNWYVPQEGQYPQAQISQAGYPQAVYAPTQRFAPIGNMPAEAMSDQAQMMKWLAANPGVSGFTAAYPNGAPAPTPGSVTYPITGGEDKVTPYNGGDLPTVVKSAVRPSKADPFGNGLTKDDVKKVQRELIASGILEPSGKKFANGEDREVDGMWGPKTQAAYEKYIAKKNLESMELMPERWNTPSMEQYVPGQIPTQAPAEPSPMPQRYAGMDIQPRRTGSALKTEKRGKDEKAYGGYSGYGFAKWLDQFK